jgi:hypothetical protein
MPMPKPGVVVCVCVAWIMLGSATSKAQELSNNSISLKLGSFGGIPLNQEAVWKATGQIAFGDVGTSGGLGDLVCRFPGAERDAKR